MQDHKRTYTFVDMTTLAQRMKLARKHANLTQKALAERAGVEQPVISQLETGKNLQSAHLAKFAHICGVSAIWLSDGVEPMLADGQAKAESNVTMALQPPQSYRYPVISWVSAGAWAEAVQPYPDGFSDRYEISDYNAKGPAYWLEVVGDSMTAPAGQSVPEGMLILVDPEADVLPGKLVVAKMGHNNEVTFKKLVVDGGTRYLKPLNPEYKMVECGEDCRILGVAVRVAGKL